MSGTTGLNAYGSIRNPDDPGSGGGTAGGGGGYPGGGVIYLASGGTLTVSGTVSAIGDANGTGSGGSIILKGNAIAGAGSVTVKGGAGGSWKGAGGGRIAIYTKEDKAFSGLAFANNVTAQGSNAGQSTCGSIYFESARHAPGCGEVIFDGKGQTNSRSSYLNTNVRDANQPFGKITVKGGSKVYVSAGVTLTLTNGLYVAASYKSGNTTITSYLRTEAATAGIYFAPPSGTTFTQEGTVSANHNFVCNAPGATVNFVSGASMVIAQNGVMNLVGAPGSPLTFNTTTGSGSWTLNVGSGASMTVSYVDVSRGTASGLAVTANDSVGDDWSKEHNWLFPESIKPGDPLTWTGGADTSWVNANNWLDKNGDNRTPEETDAITIPAGCPRYPVIIADTLANSLVIEAGATNKLSGGNLTVTNSFSCAGAFTRAKAEKLIIAGEGDATLDFANGEYGDVVITKSGGTVTLPNGLNAKRLKVTPSSATTFVLPATKKIKTDVFDIDGTSNDYITLVSSTPGTAWKLEVADVMRVRGVTVSDSNASDGRTIAAGDFATNGGGNTNWDFTSGSAVEWVGGTDNNWTTAENWSPVGVPSETAVVAIRPTSANVTVSLSTNIVIVPIGGLMIGDDSTYTASLQCNKAIEVAGGIDVGAKGTLILNSIATNNIVNCGMIVRPNGKITHTGSQASSVRLYGVNLLVKDDMLVEQGGSVNVDGMGFGYGYGPGRGSGSGSETKNPSHGGIGFYQSVAHCYGSILRPVTLGSPYPVTPAAGGGQVAIAVEGELRVDGSITADGGSTNGGSGGSIWLTAGTLRGSGTISTKGINATYGSAGGRIAIYLTEATSLGFSGTITYAAAVPQGSKPNGHGTRYYQFASSEEGSGTIYFNAGGSAGTSFPMADDGPAKSAYSKAKVCVQSGTLYVLADTKVRDIDITGGKIDLQGHTIRVLSKTHKNGKGWTGGTYANCVTENGGKIIWVNGLSVSVR